MKHLMTVLMGLCLVSYSFSAVAADGEGLAALFPDGLLSAEGEAVSLNALKGKEVVGIYFSAHWCPPCRKFTPELVKYRDSQPDDIEVVFVSSDKSEEKQFEYMKETGMKGPTVKYKSDSAKALSEKYEIRGIPTLVMVDGNGELLTREGRKMVTDKVPAAKIAKARVVKEEYKCDSCDKTHTRDKLVFDEG
jgi:nucleoredoxin